MQHATFEKLAQTVGDNGCLTGDDIGPRYYTDPRGEGPARPELVLRPASTQDVSDILRICDTARQPVVVQGGMTGLVNGACPQAGEIVLSMERMNRIETLDARARTMTVQSGTPLQVIQEAADARGLLFPLDLGARGSCTIGGNLATNAGGNRVIRFGMTRDLTLGIEAVLANGTIVNGLTGFIKNNTGYDLKQMFIGSEGTLGIVTRATLRLFPKPQSQIVAVCSLESFDDVTAFLAHMQSGIGADLSAFEVLWSKTYDIVGDFVPSVKLPLERGHAFYVLTEMMGSDPAADQDRFETVLGAALEAGLISDAVVSKSEAEVGSLWDVRDGMAHGINAQSPAVGFDISLEQARMADLESELTGRLARAFDAPQVLIGGHLGDGNLHLSVKSMSAADNQPYALIEDIVYGWVGENGGSISAEHGIGLYKRRHLPQSRSPEELDLMRILKQAMDPNGVLNPGRILGNY